RIDHSRDRRGAGRLGRAGKWNMTFPGEQAGSRVQAQPARARQEYLAPSVQVGKVRGGSARTVQRLHIRRQLDEITAGKAGGQSEVPQDLDEQPGRIAP